MKSERYFLYWKILFTVHCTIIINVVQFYGKDFVENLVYKKGLTELNRRDRLLNVSLLFTN